MKATFDSYLSDELIQRFKLLLKEGQLDQVKDKLTLLHSPDIAELFSHVSLPEQKAILSLLRLETASEVLSDLDPGLREDLLKELDEKDISSFVEEMSADDAADVISELEETVANIVLAKLEPEISEDVKKLLKYPEDSAGGIMSPHYVGVTQYATKKDAVQRMREVLAEETVTKLFIVFVTTNRGNLLGYIQLQDLLLIADNDPIATIIIHDIISVHTHADQEEVARISRKYDLASLPVVDSANKLVGRITFDDLQDVVQEESNEDHGIMAGTGAEEVLETSVLKTSRDRIPWLLFGLFGGMLSALLIRFFQPALDKMITLAFFIPVVASTAGNISIQSSSITVRGLATGEIKLIDTGRRILKELKVALINGLIVAVSISIITYFWFADLRLTVLLPLTLFCVTLISGFIGLITPLILHKANIDPALATGPFITTANDILGLCIYLGIFSMYLYSV